MRIAECPLTLFKMCEQSALWHQLAAKVMGFVAPQEEITIPEKDLPKMDPNTLPDVRHPQHRVMSDGKGKGMSWTQK